MYTKAQTKGIMSVRSDYSDSQRAAFEANRENLPVAQNILNERIILVAIAILAICAFVTGYVILAAAGHRQTCAVICVIAATMMWMLANQR
jgi:hypothetical protein